MRVPTAGVGRDHGFDDAAALRLAAGVFRLCDQGRGLLAVAAGGAAIVVATAAYLLGAAQDGDGGTATGTGGEAITLEAASNPGPNPFTTELTVNEIAAQPDAIDAVTAIQADLPTDELTGTLELTGSGRIEGGHLRGTAVRGADGGTANEFVVPTAGGEPTIGGAVVLTEANFGAAEINDTIFPVGTVLMFFGDIGDIPEGFQICDGTNGTPDTNDTGTRVFKGS